MTFTLHDESQTLSFMKKDPARERSVRDRKRSDERESAACVLFVRHGFLPDDHDARILFFANRDVRHGRVFARAVPGLDAGGDTEGGRTMRSFAHFALRVIDNSF